MADNTDNKESPPKPIYVKHNDLIKTRIKEDYTILLCDETNKSLGNASAAIGAVKDRALWAIFVANVAVRTSILQHGLNIRGTTINLCQ